MDLIKVMKNVCWRAMLSSVENNGEAHAYVWVSPDIYVGVWDFHTLTPVYEFGVPGHWYFQTHSWDRAVAALSQLLS